MVFFFRVTLLRVVGVFGDFVDVVVAAETSTGRPHAATAAKTQIRRAILNSRARDTGKPMGKPLSISVLQEVSAL